MGELGEYQSVLSRPLYLDAPVGDECAGDPDLQVEPTQRPKDTNKGDLHGRSGVWPPRKCQAKKCAIRSMPSPQARALPVFLTPKSPTRNTRS